ncbi:retropepsin-like aspartic protease [Labilibaculum sp. K2S]|uniref:retropepsin-like aspartic protease n=1 Tax=Labilibaculum sp. K2S TaxID=3056386 RepID=UPI0025A33FE8|nr:retropepsin-like aspartic protease [Labilibaculum sp. K2S]MDM8159700.1 retropepsin-like aspartic protease [Labilibaculum sp. K2S]
MKQLKEISIFLWILLSLNACVRNNETVFNEIYELTEQNNFFKAKEQFELNKNALSKPYQKFIIAVLDNAFNKLGASEQTIEDLIKNENSILDSLQFKLYETKYDNALKLYNYKEAKNTILTILSDYKKYIDNEQTDDYENSLKIWTALENTPAQKVDVKKMTNIKMEKDIAGLNTLKMFAGNDSVNFIFDTGANLSTTSLSVAKQLNMKIIPVDIEVGTITGDKVLAKLAVCNKLSMGNIDLFNVIFLVLPDDALSFPQINYQIYGILGFPVIEALKEIRITPKGDFIVPLVESTSSECSNMAMNGLTPLIYINDKHFTFDTGADQTMLYQRFYEENQEEIDKNYQSETISFGGAGGRKEFDGYNIDYILNIGGEQVKLQNISLLKEKIKESETVYGNIGQDLIQKFDTMIINFDKMFIRFE